jgi:hypothetical protein
MSDTPDRKEFALLPAENTGLSTRSSALVKRGLETLALQQGRIVRFPADRSMGSFQLWDPQKNSTQTKGEARGDITVPPGMKLGLSISDEAIFDISPLASLGPDDLQFLYFFWPRVPLEDGDLLQFKPAKIFGGIIFTSNWL